MWTSLRVVAVRQEHGLWGSRWKQTQTTAAHAQHGKEVVYDAEHFFDGYIHNREYALQRLAAVLLAGADVLCLCDTNAGTLTETLTAIVAEKQFEGTHKNAFGCSGGRSLAADDKACRMCRAV